jgi:hypothetical protein
MLKKILVGGFLLIMVGAVVAGAIALFTPSEDAHARQGRGQGAIANQGTSAQLAGNGQGRGQGGRTATANRSASAQVAPGGQGRAQGEGRGLGAGGGAQAKADDVAPASGEGRGRGQGNPQRARTESQAEALDTQTWQTIEGTVLQTEELVIETADGQTVQVGLGPSHYRESQGFVLQTGEQVRVSGHLEDGEFKAGQIENLDTGQSIVLRDASGRPMWAGQGRRQGD